MLNKHAMNRHRGNGYVVVEVFFSQEEAETSVEHRMSLRTKGSSSPDQRRGGYSRG